MDAKTIDALTKLGLTADLNGLALLMDAAKAAKKELNDLAKAAKQDPAASVKARLEGRLAGLTKRIARLNSELESLDSQEAMYQGWLVRAGKGKSEAESVLAEVEIHFDNGKDGRAERKAAEQAAKAERKAKAIQKRALAAKAEQERKASAAQKRAERDARKAAELAVKTAKAEQKAADLESAI